MLHLEDSHEVVPPRLAFRTRRATASQVCRAGGGPAVSALGGDARGCWGGHAEDPCARKGPRDPLAGKPASAPDTPGQGEDDALRGAPVCAQLESSSVVLYPVSRGPRSAPIIDQLCARSAARRQHSLGSAAAADQDCTTPSMSAATMPTDPLPGARGSAHAETELARVCDGLRHGLAMASPQYRSDTRCAIVTRLWAFRAGV